ncbi:MAG TPA: LysM peptidoglycan-binding domain-containing protein [Bauldia sp.]|nr:LysM peptidoglycan-binding domain-containing protein [Bauldia sp.]
MERRALTIIAAIAVVIVLVALAAYDVTIGRLPTQSVAVAPPAATAPAEAPPPPADTAAALAPAASTSETAAAPIPAAPADGTPAPAAAGTEMAALPPATGAPATEAPPSEAGPVMPSFDVVRVEPSGDTVLAGEAAPNSKVEILDGSTTIAQADSGDAGDWALPLDKPLAPGTHDLAIRTTSKDSTVVTLSDQRVTVSVPEPPSKDVLVVVNTPDAASKVLEGAEPGAAATAEVTPPAAQAAPPAAPSAGSTGTQVATAETPPAAPAPTTPAETAAAAPAAPNAPAGETTQTAETTPPAAAAPAETAPAAGTSTQPEQTAEVAPVPAESAVTTPPATESAETAEATPGTEVTPAPQMAEAAPPKEAPVTTEPPIAGEPKVTLEPPVGTEAPATAEAPPATPPPPPPPAQPNVVVAAVEADTAGNVYIAGTATTPETVRVYMDDQPLGEAKPSPSGTWLVETKKDMPAGNYDVRADQIGSDGTVIARAEVPFQREVDVAVLTPSGSAGGSAGSGATVSGAMPPMETVIIKRGDNLWRIARSTWGKGVRWSTIYQANTDQIRNPHWIYPGQVFIMPKGNVTWTD